MYYLKSEDSENKKNSTKCFKKILLKGIDLSLDAQCENSPLPV